LEETGFPVAPAILGVVLGGMLEENFITSMIKSDGRMLAFFTRPLAAALGVLTLAAWFLPPIIRRFRQIAGACSELNGRRRPHCRRLPRGGKIFRFNRRVA